MLDGLDCGGGVLMVTRKIFNVEDACGLLIVSRHNEGKLNQAPIHLDPLDLEAVSLGVNGRFTSLDTKKERYCWKRIGECLRREVC